MALSEARQEKVRQLELLLELEKQFEKLSILEAAVAVEICPPRCGQGTFETCPTKNVIYMYICTYLYIYVGVCTQHIYIYIWLTGVDFIGVYFACD